MYNGQLELETDVLETGLFELEGDFEVAQEIGAESAFNEAEEMEFAAELLEITDEAELDLFLGKLIKRAWRGIRKVGKGILRPLGSALKAVAKKALPFVAGAAGTFFGGPAGGALGASLGSALSKALEMEYEALSPEDREFEMARSFVRVAGAAAKQAALVQPGTDAQKAIQNALVAAARQQVPALGRTGNLAAGSGGRRRSGRWVRRGRTIILIGI